MKPYYRNSNNTISTTVTLMTFIMMLASFRCSRSIGLVNRLHRHHQSYRVLQVLQLSSSISSNRGGNNENGDYDDSDVGKRQQKVQDALSTTDAPRTTTASPQQSQHHWSKGIYDDDIQTPWDDVDGDLVYNYNENFEPSFSSEATYGSDVAKRRPKLRGDDLVFGRSSSTRKSNWKRGYSNDAQDDNGVNSNGDNGSNNGESQPKAKKTNTKLTEADIPDDLLSPQQRDAIQLITQTDSNVFITGVAGTGKTLVIQRAIQHLKNTLEDDEWVALAPTGTAAIAMGGQTIHTFAKIGISSHREECFRRTKSKHQKQQWNKLKTIIIDEISMVSGELWDRLSEVVCDLRRTKHSKPFGGIQLIVCGDFLQLPPIPARKADVQQMTNALVERGMNDEQINNLLFLNRGYCFQGKAWKDANFENVQLQQVFRQEESSFVNILKDIRKGIVTQEAKHILLGKCNRPLPPNEFGIEPTILHSKNKNVHDENMRELRKLKRDKYTFAAKDSVDVEENAPPWAKEQLQNNAFFKTCLADKELHLKEGAQVMLVKNDMNAQLVNGSRGKVVGFSDATGYPIVQFVSGRKRTIKPQKFESRMVGLGSVSREAIPLRLAWAVTTHKSQGLTLDYVIADLKHVFADAQAYVALSRVSDENGLQLKNFAPWSVRANPIALSFYSNPQGPFPHWENDNSASYSKSQDRKSKLELDQVSSSLPPKNKKDGTNQTVNNDFLEGKTIVLTGVFESFDRKTASSMVERYGGDIRQSVSGKTNYLVVGSKQHRGKSTTSGKDYRTATEIINSDKNKSSLQILSEEEFKNIVKQLPKKE